MFGVVEDNDGYDGNDNDDNDDIRERGRVEAEGARRPGATQGKMSPPVGP